MQQNWIALSNAAHIGVVTIVQWQLFLQHNVHSHTKSIDRLYYPGGKTLKVQALQIAQICYN